MGKSCKNCRYYNIGRGYCYKKETNIIDKMGATYCKIYKEKRKLPNGPVKCVFCTNLNKYGWCLVKKKCFDEDEQEKERKCIKFKVRKKKKSRNL